MSHAMVGLGQWRIHRGLSRAKAQAWVEKELKRGLPVYLFEVADMLGWDAARKLMSQMELAKIVRRVDMEADRPRYERGENFW